MARTMRVFSQVLTLLLLPSCIIGAPIGPWQNGTTAHYGGPTDVDPNHPAGTAITGRCGYGAFTRSEWPFWALASISPESSIYQDPASPKFGCGRCVEIRCAPQANCPASSPSVTALVADTCSGCPADQINLPSPVFRILTDPSLGIIPVMYRQVECTPPGTITVQLLVLRPDMGGYVKLNLLGVAGSGAIKGVSIRPTHLPGALVAPWLPLANTFGASWEASGFANSLPYDLLIVNMAGNQLVAPAILKSAPSGTFNSTVQFPLVSTTAVQAKALATKPSLPIG